MSGDSVGYKKPPKRTQFRKGASGNPKGRPKRSLNLLTELKAELSEIVTVREGGRATKLPKGRALVKQLVARGMSGDARAAFTVMKLSTAFDSAEPGSDQISPEDDEIIRDFLQRQMKSG